jgi:hypothetical protein
VWRPSIQGEEQGLSSALEANRDILPFGVKAGWILFNGKFQSKLHFVALVDAD